MALPKFDYLAPKSIGEACAALAANPEAKLIAGGQSLLRVMKFRIMAPECLVDLKAIPDLRYVEHTADKLRIGALATQSDTAVRNSATVVGNICVGHTASDPSAALLALGAELVVVSPAGERILPIAELFVGHMTTALDLSDLVREIRIPRPKAMTGMAYLAHAGRSAMETPLVSAGAVLVSDEKECTAARIALAGAADTPIRVNRAEEALVGNVIDEKLIQYAASIAAEDCSPDSDVYASGEYRRRLVAFYVRDVLRSASKRLSERNVEK
jgi:carbon-monoxide dehydrogenase medium subunit